jgi:hypothetical protein
MGSTVAHPPAAPPQQSVSLAHTSPTVTHPPRRWQTIRPVPSPAHAPEQHSMLAPQLSPIGAQEPELAHLPAMHETLQQSPDTVHAPPIGTHSAAMQLPAGPHTPEQQSAGPAQGPAVAPQAVESSASRSSVAPPSPEWGSSSTIW